MSLPYPLVKILSIINVIGIFIFCLADNLIAGWNIKLIKQILHKMECFLKKKEEQKRNLTLCGFMNNRNVGYWPLAQRGPTKSLWLEFNWTSQQSCYRIVLENGSSQLLLSMLY